MEQSDFDSITTRVRHLRENVTELQKNYDELTLHVKVSGNVQQADLDIVQTSIHGVGYAQRMLWKALERPLLKTGSPSVTHKEKVHQVEPRQVPQVIEPGKADPAYISHSPKEKGQLAEPSQGIPVTEPGHTSSSSNLEETEHQASEPDVSGQPTTSGVKEGETSLRPQKGPKPADTNTAGSHWFFNHAWEMLLKGMEFDTAHFITDVSDWVGNAVKESWHNNPHLKRGDELEIKFITVASEDMTNHIRYPSFHFMKLQRPDHRSANYIKHQETKPELVINLTEDDVTTRRTWGVWVCLTEMDKVKYPFKIYQNSVNGSFLLNTMTGNTTSAVDEYNTMLKAALSEQAMKLLPADAKAILVDTHAVLLRIFNNPTYYGYPKSWILPPLAA
ncbi:hypothetical protein ACS0TY_019665 [Phlomoides rotata]